MAWSARLFSSLIKRKDRKPRRTILHIHPLETRAVPAVTGLVFNDQNGNGIREAADVGIANVAVSLFSNGTQVGSSTTDSNGAYSFSDVQPSTAYQVRIATAQSALTGRTLVAANQGSDDAIDSDAVLSGGNATVDFTTDGSASNVAFDAGFTAPAGTGSISGTVFRDADADGVMDTGETGISGVQLTLTGTDNLNQPVSLSATTSSTGAFTFSNLRPGTYTIVETQPTGWTDGKETAGPAGGNATAVNDQISGIVLTASQSATGYLFAETSSVDLTLTQHLGSTSAQPGSTFVITYTLKNEGQVAALDVDVDIDLGDLEFVSANSTDFVESTGIWSAGDVAAGASKSLEITVRVPDFGSFSPKAVVTQVANGILTNNDAEGTVAGASPSFWYLASGWDPLFNVAIVTSGSSVVDATTPSTAPPSLTLGNLVYRDNNGNSQFDTGDVGVSGVVLELLDGSGNPISGGTATTDANGAYTFAGLAAGDYRVRLAASSFQTGGALAGFTSSSTTAADPDDNVNNNNDGQVTGVLGSGGFIRSGAITLALTTEPTNDGDTNNNTNLTLDFGVVQVAANTLTLGDRVFRDADGNGLFEGAETGVAGVSVQLLNSTGTVIQTVTTDSTGLYAFSNLTAGDYRVRLAATNFNAGSALAGFTASATSVADPDNDVDNDSNAVASGTLGSGGFIESGLITLAVGSEPGTGGNTNLTLDFGVVPPPPPATPTLELNAASDTGTQGDDTTDLPNVTLVGTTTANVAVKLVQTGATTTSSSSGAFTFTGVPVILGDNAFAVEATNGGGTTSFTTTIIRNAAPTVVNPLDPVPLAVNGSTIIDVAGTFDDADITNTRIAFNTSEGTINVELFDRQAPKTVANFLNYVSDGDFTDSIFHRSAELPGGIPFVLQGGGFTFESSPTPSLVAVPTDPAVANEPDAVNRSNVLGTLAMAKLGNDPNSATSQFFFNLGDNSANLNNQNGGFTVFGKVVASADQAVVDALAAIPTQDQGAAANLPPSQLGTFTDIPLTNYTGTQFPTDTTAGNYALINGVSIVSQTEVLTYSIVNNSNPTVASAVLTDNRIAITGLQAGQTTLTIRATDQSGSTVQTTITVTVA